MSDKRLQLLHVDDDEDDRFFLARAVRAAAVPITITDAKSGPEALRKLQASAVSPDMLLLDIRMPQMSGFEFLEALKRIGKTSLPVVMFSNSQHQSDIERARQMGAHAYCVKPSGLDQLVDFVKRLYQAWTRAEVPCEWPAPCPETQDK